MVEEYPDDVRNDVVEDEDDYAEPAPEDGVAPTEEDLQKLVDEAVEKDD
jgi:hypothetical protein